MACPSGLGTAIISPRCNVHVPGAGLPFIAGRENIRLYDIVLAARPGNDVIAGNSDVSRLLAPIRKNGLHRGRNADTPGQDFAILAIDLAVAVQGFRNRLFNALVLALATWGHSKRSHSDLSGRDLEGVRVPKPQPFRLLL